MHTYHRGLFIGRFQPFHKGHLFVLKKALESVETIVIGVGSANKKDKDNPLNFNTRKEILEKFIKDNEWENRISEIIALDDTDSDEKWITHAILKAGVIDVVIGNNDWVNNLFKSAGIPAFRTSFFYRDQLEGQNLRKRIKQGKKWDNLVPKEVFDLEKSHLSHTDF